MLKKINNHQSRLKKKNFFSVLLSILHLGSVQKDVDTDNKNTEKITENGQTKIRTQAVATPKVVARKTTKKTHRGKIVIHGERVVERHMKRLLAKSKLQGSTLRHGIFEPINHVDMRIEPQQQTEEVQEQITSSELETDGDVTKKKGATNEAGSSSDFLGSVDSNKPIAEASQSADKENGLALEFTDKKDDSQDKKAESTSADEKALRKKVEEEGFLESADGNDAAAKKHSLFSLFGKEDALQPAQQKSLSKEEEKAEIKKAKEQAEKDKEEEKIWREEAKSREKNNEDDTKNKGKKADQKNVDWKIPKLKKQNAFQRFVTALGNVGLEKERTGFIDNLATMMEAGLPLLDALRVLEKEARKRPMRKIIGRIVVAVEVGSPLWRAMDGQYFFKQQQIAMIRVGEEAGSLVENMKYLAEQETRDHALKSKVKTAMIYPIIVFVMLTGMVFGLGFFILPNLVGVLTSLGVPLPFVTRAIIKVTGIFSDHGIAVISSFSSTILVLIVLTKYTKFKIIMQWILYKIPGIGKLIKEATLSRFGVVIGGLLQAGVPITEALDSLVNATSLARYKNFYSQLLERVQLGDSFETSFGNIKTTDKCFPVSIQQLIMTGEKSGSLTKIMMKIADIHDKEASDIAEKLPVIIEPLLLLVIGGLVGTIALGVLGPIYSIVGNIG